MKLVGLLLLIAVLQTSNIHSAFGLDSLWDWTNTLIDSPAKIKEKVTLVFTPDIYTAVFLPLKDLRYIGTHHSFDFKKKTVVYIHGWLESGQLDLSVLAIRSAYLDRGDHNVISVDWSQYAKNVNYRTRVIPQMKVIAETIAEEIVNLVEAGTGIQDLHLVGHSLGGQMVGKIGRHLTKITNGRLTVPKIIALDPAGPGFEDHSIDGFEPITRTDGDYVQIIHTCAGKLGMQHRVGTTDFYPDGGSNHPGCDVDVTSSMLESYKYVCDHARSWHYYQSSVRDPERFPAVRCASWDDFVAGEGAGSGSCNYSDINYLGFGANPKESGKYFLQTNGNMFNLSRKMDGIRYMRVNLTRLMIPGGAADIPPEVEESVIF